MNTERKGSILIVEDDKKLLDSYCEYIRNDGWTVRGVDSAEESLKILSEDVFFAIVCDLKLKGSMSGIDLLKALRERGDNTPFIVITAFGDIPTAVLSMKLGAKDFLMKGDFSLDELTAKIRSLEYETTAEPIAKSAAMKKVLELARTVAKTDANVLITGESGVGKEVVARYIHNVSPRANRHFVAVNVAAVPDNLLESELFGYEKGAFTGAEKRKLGKFEMASGGTILLDEIGEMSINLQAKLLRIVQDKRVERLGGTKSFQVDSRIISTTNKDLKKMVEEGKFREDLYFRLNVFPLIIPPLRERKEDIIPLAEYFVSFFAKRHGKNLNLSNKAIEKILNYDWKGNVRELQNVMERAAILCNGNIIDDTCIVLEGETISVQEKKQETERKDIISDDKSELNVSDLNIKEMERIYIKKALERTKGNRTHAANLLGITVRTLRNKLKEMSVET